MKGSSFEDWVQRSLVENNYIPASSVYTYATAADSIKALDRKDVDMIMLDQDLYEQQYRDSGKYQVFYTGFYTQNYAFGARKDSSIISEINKHLGDMIKDGTAQNIANRYFAMDFTEKENTIERPAATLAPVATQQPSSASCVNAMSYVADVTVKDGEVYRPGAGFRKTWRIYNNGTCTWNTNYYLDFASGDRMNGNSVRIPTTVQPGQTVDISVDLTAPNANGKYKGNWQMRSPQGANFGQVIWVSIQVNGNAYQPTATPQSGQKRIVPVINYFYADSTEGHMGDSTTVYWSVSNAAGVTITVNGTMIENSSTMTGYAPVSATIQRVGVHEIKLVAHSVTDDTSASIYYNMKDEEGQKRVIPVIDYFYAESDEGTLGSGTMLYWSVSNAAGVTITVDGNTIENTSATQGATPVNATIQSVGVHEIRLTAHTVTDDATSVIYYTTKDESGWDGEGQQRVVPSIDYFYCDPDAGFTGDMTTVHWSVSNAGGVTISVDGYTIVNLSDSSGSYSLQAPIQSTGTHTITLTAHSVTDDASASAYFTMYEDPTAGGNFDSGEWDDTYTTQDDWQIFEGAYDDGEGYW